MLIQTDIEFIQPLLQQCLTLCLSGLGAGLSCGCSNGVSHSVWLECRAKLWRASVPEQAPVASDVDWESLGKGYQLAGGSIKQAVVRAATQAALRIEVGC